MNSVTTTPIIECRKIAKQFNQGSLAVDVFEQIDFTVQPGEQVAIVGASGAGKSTLLHILGGLDKPSKGEVLVDGKNIHKLSERSRSKLRNQKLGFVYQFHHLLPEFTALENTCIPLLIRKVAPNVAKEKAKVILEKVGLGNRLKHKLAELSGGERQRTAIARALVAEPQCVLADEPTGNLDFRTADKVYETMLELNRSLKTSFIIVTHDMHLAKYMDKTYRIENGKLELI